MTGPATLALLLAPRLDEGVAELVRLCVGLVAGGGSVTLVEAGPGTGVLSAATDLPDEVERNLAGLADCGVVPRAVSPEALHDMLHAAERLIRVSSSTRSGTPELLVVDDAYLERGAERLVEDLTNAGQVIRA